MTELSVSTSKALVVDKALIQRCISGHRKSQEFLYNTYAPTMYAICLRYAGNAQNAQDILQDGFIRVFNNLDKFRYEGAFEGWMKRIFINVSIEYYRKSIAAQRHLDLDRVREQKSAEADPVSRLAKKDLMGLVQELPVGYRTVFNLYALEGYTHKEVAKTLGISEGTSKSQLARARAMLQRLLKANP